jgi:hypothetical protein
MASRLAVIVIDDVNPPKVADFWCKVLDWRVLEFCRQARLARLAQDAQA